MRLFSLFLFVGMNALSFAADNWDVSVKTYVHPEAEQAPIEINRAWFKDHRSTIVYFINDSAIYAQSDYNRFIDASKALSPLLYMGTPTIIVIDPHGYDVSMAKEQLDARRHSDLFKLNLFLTINLTKILEELLPHVVTVEEPDTNLVVEGPTSTSAAVTAKGIDMQRVRQLTSVDELSKRIHFILDDSQSTLTTQLAGEWKAGNAFKLRIVNKNGEFVF